MSTDSKKYQVFVSSTYHDLLVERQEIMHVLLELDCIPSGMELFPAADDDQWSLIKGVIDDCDYYIVVIAGRYGSLGPSGQSYTEMEYRYALEIGKPIMAFLHADPLTISAKETEPTDEGKEKLKAFRAFAQLKMCKLWANADALGSVVSRSLVTLMKQRPGIGWVRGDRILNVDASNEILRLRDQVAELSTLRTQPPQGSVDLAQGDELFEVHVSYRSSKEYETYTWNHTVQFVWSELFFTVGPMLMGEASTAEINERIRKEVRKRVLTTFGEEGDTDVDESHQGHDVTDYQIEVLLTDLETILVQFIALGYIIQKEKQRSVKDRGDYWTLTPYGLVIMTQLRAVPRRPD